MHAEGLLNDFHCTVLMQNILNELKRYLYLLLLHEVEKVLVWFQQKL